MYTIITDLFDIDIHIFTDINFLYNLVVKFKYIYLILTHKLNKIFINIYIHIFTVIKFLFNLVVKFKYIYTLKYKRSGVRIN